MGSYLNTVNIWNRPTPLGSDPTKRNHTMSLSKLTFVERLFDRSVAAFTLVLGLALSVGTVLVGA